MSASIFSIRFNKDRLGFGAATCPNQAFTRLPLQKLIGRGQFSMWPHPRTLLTLYQRCGSRKNCSEGVSNSGHENISGGLASSWLIKIFFSKKILFYISKYHLVRKQGSINDIKPNSTIRNGKKKAKGLNKR